LTPCNLVEIYRHFGRHILPSSSGSRVSKSSNKRERSSKQSELFDPEDEGNMFLLNVGELLSDYRNVISQKIIDSRVTALRNSSPGIFGRVYCIL
jgi:hypothetical protein